MAAVAALPPSHFNPSLSSSRRLQNSVSDERRNLAQSSSTDAELQPTNFSAVSTLTHAQQPTASDLGTFDTVNMRSEHRSIKPSSSAARAQLLNPNTSSRPSQLPRGHLWKEALKAPIQFVAGQKITSGHDIPYEPINRPILPGQGKGVLVSAMGPALSQEDDAIHAESSPVESLPPSTPGSSKQVRVGSNSADQPHSLIGPVKPATGPGSRSAGAALYQAATRLDQSNIVTTWPKLQRMGPGFDNTGNTCFLNATLQALVYTPALAIGLLDRAEHRSDTCCLKQRQVFCAICNMQNLLNLCLRTNTRPRSIRPSPISSHLSRIAPRMRGGRQEDAHEFLRLLVESMQNAALGGKESKVKQSEKEATFIHRMFAGKLRSRVTCESCKSTSDTFENFLDLSLDIGKVDNLVSALAKIRQCDQLRGQNQYQCDRCKGLRNAQKEVNVCQAPPILTLHMKRFNGRGRKVNKAIKFNEDIDLSVAMSEDAPSARYKLYAVVCHQGTNNTSGHYYSDIKTSDGQWHRTDDSHIDKINRHHVLSNSEAYICFYARDPDDHLQAAIRNNRASAGPSMGLHNDRFDTPGRKRKSSQSNDAARGRPRIIGPLMPDRANLSTSQPSQSPLQDMVTDPRQRLDTSMFDANSSYDASAEDLGELMPCPKMASLVDTVHDGQRHHRKRPKHRMLVNGNDRSRHVSQHRLNSMPSLHQPRTIRG